MVKVIGEFKIQEAITFTREDREYFRIMVVRDHSEVIVWEKEITDEDTPMI